MATLVIRGVHRVEVTANQHALDFYTKVGFAVGYPVETTSPRDFGCISRSDQQL